MSSFSLDAIIARKKRELGQDGDAPFAKKQKKYRSKREIDEEKRLAVRKRLVW
jgi:hypothetical protein